MKLDIGLTGRAILPAAFLTLLPASLPAQSRLTMFPPVRGLHEMVGSCNNFEVDAGMRILSQGGNAVDAGVATVLAAGVTELDHFGLGGEIPILIKMDGHPVIAISGIGTAPKRATVAFYRSRRRELWEQPGHMPPMPAEGILAAPVPGVMDALILALERYGTMSFAQVSAPAIEDADGFPITEVMADWIRGSQPLLQLWPTSREFFLPGGVAPRRGEVFHEPALARTLRALAAAEAKAKGSRVERLRAIHNYFYKGPIAREIASFCEHNGGLISYDDMAGFHAEVDTPRTGTYRGYQIYKPGFWSQGPVMIETLNLLEGYDLRAMGHNSPAYIHTLVEAIKLAFADRDRYYGDPKFSKIPEHILLSKEYAAERRKLIDPNHASLEERPGTFGGPLPMPASTESTIAARDTTCVNVVDRARNLFSATPSGGWLPSVIAGSTGLAMSERMQTFVLIPGHPNELAPGKRPRVTLSPLIVLKDGKPFLAMSTPGGDLQDQTLLQVFLNIVEFNMSPQEAIESPRFDSAHLYTSFDFHEFLPGKLNVERRIPQATIERLIAMGHKVTVVGDWANLSAPTAILIDTSDGVLTGGADPRRSRFIYGR
ncbi:MAG TPA: gamma-glutamyltransferase family protein [Bryobacteraceae bacterium]|nr:gamma-glutamyltransferase family protein [Bryobacteraceae bacterium]